MRKLCFATLLALGLGACGDDGHDVEPTLAPGGGIHDPGIDGEVNVYVIDEKTDEPLAGATVRVGTLEGMTDATGLFVAKGDLKDKQTIIAKATDYATSMWIGVDGANVTMPLTRATSATTDVPHAELDGTVNGWDALPAPAVGHANVALVTYSQSRKLGDDEGNNLAPPATMSNVCLRGPAANTPCNWRINARAGTIAVAAALADYDTKGTAQTTDDTITINNFAIKQPLTVVDGATQSGIALDILPAGNTTTASVNFGTPPAGYSDVNGVVGVDLGDLGVLRISQVTTTGNTVVVPSLSAVPGATGFEFLGFSQEPVTDGTAGKSVVLRRGITSPSGMAAGEWLAAPTGLASDRTQVSLVPNSAAALTIIEIDTKPSTGTGNRAMGIAIFDDTTTVELPVDFAPLPTGSLSVTANAFDVPQFDPDNFDVDALGDTIARLASESIILN